MREAVHEKKTKTRVNWLLQHKQKKTQKNTHKKTRVNSRGSSSSSASAAPDEKIIQKKGQK
jgi:hypothetical protein